MADREKVINGLECAIQYGPHYCGGEFGDENEYSRIEQNVLVDALALLKAQEPRIVTLEEVKAMKRYTICAVEQRSKVLHTTFNAEYYGTVTIGQRNYLDFGLYADVNPFRRSEGGYGKTWRCWTSRPTDEQREAEPWN